MATKNTTTQRKAYYRRCQMQPQAKQSLQQLLTQALANKKLAKDRLEATDPAANSFRIISDFKKVGSMLCGTLLTFERGSHQLVIQEDLAATSLVMAALVPPTNKGKAQQFVPGVLFFCIFGNHIAIVQSAGLRASGMEQHLAWFLRDECGLLGRDAGLALVDEPKKATKDRIRRSHVKSVSIGRPLMGEATHLSATHPSTKSQGKNVTKFNPDPSMMAMLKNFLTDDKFSKLGIEDAVFDGNLEVWLEIRYPKYSRSQPTDTIKLMDNLGISLRDQDEDSVALELADGTTVHGSDLKITGSINLRLRNGVPDLESFYSDMSSWMGELIKNNTVSQ